MNRFRIKKTTGTYAEMLEAYGVSNLLHKIFNALNILDAIVVITDRDLYYEITINVDLNKEMLDKLTYFPLFKYIKQKSNTEIGQYPDCYDYPTQRLWRKEKNEMLQVVYRECQGREKTEERDRRIAEIERIFKDQKVLDVEYDVYAQIASPNNFPSFEKLYGNFYRNKNKFADFVKEILSYYSDENHDLKVFEKTLKGLDFLKNVTATQLYHPNQGQGLNKPKADGLNRKNFDSFWITETMKVSGALSDMVCQLVKVGNAYDLKISVIEYKQVNYRFKLTLVPAFKKYLKGNTPIKIDVLNVLLLTQKMLEHTEFMGRKVKNIVSGLYSVYQKDLGQNKAVVNIGFIQVPDFIEIGTKEENQDWIDVLEEQRQIIGSIDELGSTVQGLKLYRDFISGSDLNCFFDFAFWYGVYVSNGLSNKKYVRVFTVRTLNKFYNCMDAGNLKLEEIIENKGFQAVASAIRKSTVSLQYTPKDERRYEIRYGIAQALQVKSKSKADLTEFVGEFIARYNAETARRAEKEGKSTRANVREDELMEFYFLLDKFSPKLVGAMLASYGFALPAKKQLNVEENMEKDVLEEKNEE